MTTASAATPIGIFDSGVGGLSVLRAVRRELPAQPVIYFADQAHVPYGPRSLDEVRSFATGITEYLLSQGAGLITVACNAASAAALKHLRAVFPQVHFVGMEPAVKPAAETTHSGVVGVLATPATFQGALYASVVERFGSGVTILQDTCPGLVQQIEAGRLMSAETRTILQRALDPMLSQGIDTVVLGCTHYPFVIPLIEEIAGAGVRVIDPAPAVARQIRRLLEMDQLAAVGTNRAWMRCLTSGSPRLLEDLLPAFAGETVAVEGLCWVEGKLLAAV
jgi:glutamate racemase